MEIDTIFEIITTNPWCYFVAGLLTGYSLRFYLTTYRTRRPGRYQAKKLLSADKRVAFRDDLQEPTFDLPDSVLKTFTAQRLSNNITLFDQNSREPSM